MKKLILLTLTLLIAFNFVIVFAESAVNGTDTAAGSTQATGNPIPALYNPLPDIYEKVSPSVVVLNRVTYTWDAKTDKVTREEQGEGSAVYVKEGGYFLTNYHVIEDCDELEIYLEDGTTYEAFVVGGDEAVDVAVIKVDEKLDMTPVPMGSSSALRIGDMVCAIGTPLDYVMMYNTFSVGYVSGLERYDADYNSKRAVGLIQMDVSINPGNSGGALLNLKGELVGIPYMKYTGYYYKEAGEEEFMAYEGLCFAVPIDIAWPIASSIIETGTFVRPRFGVTVKDNEGPEEPLKNYPPAGLMIEEVEKDGSGARAGLRAGDVITHVNGTRIKNFREYTKIIDKLGAGESFKITVVRYKDENGNDLKKFETLELEVTLEIID